MQRDKSSETTVYPPRTGVFNPKRTDGTFERWLKKGLHKSPNTSADKGYVHFCQKVGAMNTKFDDKMNLESLKGCQ